MPTRGLIVGRCGMAAALVLTMWLAAQVTVAIAATPELSAQVVAQQLPTPTPFRFLTPTPLPRTTTTTTLPVTTTTTAPRAGGLPIELALPILASGLAAIGGGTAILRRKAAR